MSNAYRRDITGPDAIEPLTGHDDDKSNGLSRRKAGVKNHVHQSNTFSATPFSPPPAPESNHNRLESLTLGGYGPVGSNENYGSDISKFKYQKLHVRMFNNCVSFMRYIGCSNHDMLSREGPDGDYYRDEFNDQSYSCSVGHSEENGIWMNQSDTPGTIMAFMVWVLLGYSAITITFLAETGGIHPSLSMLYVILCSMALASHAKVQFTDPGCVPASAQPVESIRRMYPDAPLTMCSQCQTFKPPFSHHCRICNRCVSRMDHHCPWMNNCVGAGNLKHFILFLLYTWLCSAFSLGLLGWNYFFCVDEECTFSTVLVQLTRVMTCLGTGAFLFTSSMIMNVTYGIITGIGTIDRLKKKATDTMMLSDEEPIALKDIFGIAGYHTWIVPIDPVFEDHDIVMGYSTPQRLLREQMLEKSMGELYASSSVMSPSGDLHL